MPLRAVRPLASSEATWDVVAAGGVSPQGAGADGDVTLPRRIDQERPEPAGGVGAAGLKHLGGDRLMAEVLACVPRHGLEAVVVAAELILAAGNTRVEHIKNVLSRLQEATRPAVVETALTVHEPPLADAGRYDRLHGEVDHA